MRTHHFAHWLGTLLFGLLLCPSTQAHEFTVHKSITWASPGDVPLTLDIYVPKTGKKQYPVLVIYHGGGWLINNNSIMNSMSEYIASHGEFVVANMNYRLLSDNKAITLNQIVEDAFGGLLWVKSHIAKYQGDPTRIAVTGDSAGGQLASMIVTQGRKLESDGFGGDSLGFKPTGLPWWKSAERIAKKDGLKVQAAILSYGAFDFYEIANNGFESPTNIFWLLAKTKPRGIFGEDINVKDNPDYYKAISPIYNIPQASDYKLPPQFVMVGSRDGVTKPEAVKKYAGAVEKAGQPLEFKLYEGRNHAFLDNDCNKHLGTCFDRDAPEALDDMLVFLNKTLKP